MSASSVADSSDDVPLLFPRWALDRLSRAQAGLAAQIADDIADLDGFDPQTDDPAQLKLWLADFIQRLPMQTSQGDF